jgi:hypothetical protein
MCNFLNFFDVVPAGCQVILWGWGIPEITGLRHLPSEGLLLWECPLSLACYPTLQTKSGSPSPNFFFRLHIVFNRPHLRRWRHQCRCWFTCTYQHCNVKNWRYRRRSEDMGPFEFSVPSLGPRDDPSNPDILISGTFTYLKHHPIFFHVVILWCLCVLLFPSKADPTMPWFPMFVAFHWK